MPPEEYARTKPILAARLAEYILTHRDCYDRISAFTEGRYGEVMTEVRESVRDDCPRLGDFPILPTRDGPTILKEGSSKPRTYWQKQWIQLYLEVLNWLPSVQQRQAKKRLAQLNIVYR